MDLKYIVIARQPIFRSDVRRWLRRLPGDQTWQDFQDVFTDAHQELRDTEASVDEIGFQSANAIVSQIVEELHNEKNIPNQTPETHLIQLAPPPRTSSGCSHPRSYTHDSNVYDADKYGSHACTVGCHSRLL